MKSPWPYIITIISLVVVCIVAIDSCSKQQRKYTGALQVVSVRNDTIKKYKDYAGREHAEKLQARADMETIEAMYESLLDSVSRSTNVRKKDIQTVNTISTKNSNRVITRIDTIYTDTNKHHYEFNYSDTWTIIRGSIKDSVLIQYMVYDSVIISAVSRKQKGLFNFKRDIYVDGYSLNPNTKITGLNSVNVITTKRKKWGAGPYIGVSFDGRQIVPSAGLSVNYDLIQF